MLREDRFAKDSAAGRTELEKRMELRRAAEGGQEFKPLVRGWCLGSEAFPKELLTDERARRGRTRWRRIKLEIHALSAIQ